MKFKRQTSYSLEELLALAIDEETNLPKGIIVNEIGTIFLNGKDEAGRAEKYLISLLEDKSPDNRAIAFYLISSAKEADGKNKETLASFKRKPENKSCFLS